ncbi:MAG: toxic anion resistance protein [Oscillospiraceae bacterium]|nr:toxic anion resistance protein [Oscillospiraceae bacterium]MCI7500090.1 toxic anion resistance protein [Oscillospiraceae bacterium]MDD7280087.1 toxic anion resistance protein [Oscillospiraceae bacterium]MDY2864512.1 toxic anion resistance protein [Oscillospiraceae bacterium]
MALQFTPSEERKSEVINTEATVADAAPTELNLKITEPQTYSMVDTSNQIKQELASSDEIDKLVSTINANDPNSIITFGNQVAEEISKASDQVLNSMNMSQLDDSSELLNALKNIMDQFDAKELTEEKKGLFANLRRQLDKILAKYHTMGEDVDKIYVQLKQYESEIQQSNVKLETMYNANIDYYKQLLKYIMAGEQACKELDAYITDFRAKVENNPDAGTAAMDLQTLEQTRGIMEQRVMDLKIAENVAMQTVPMLKAMEFSNINLIRKINSAFIITMPVFKQALAQAVMLKRQRIQADAMKALDDKTNELLLKNAQNTVDQTKITTMLANGSSIKVETLEKTWQTIVNGIDETRKLQEEARTKRAEDSKRLEKLKEEYKAKMNS